MGFGVGRKGFSLLWLGLMSLDSLVGMLYIVDSSLLSLFLSFPILAVSFPCRQFPSD